MFLLIAEFSHLFEVLMDSGNEQFTAVMDFLFHHAKWEGLHFWDLVQPFFMFIVGVSIPLSYANRKKRGDSEIKIRPSRVSKGTVTLCFLAGDSIVSGQRKLCFSLTMYWPNYRLPI